MKYTGAILLWVAFTLAGMNIATLLKKRVAIIDETIIFMDSLIAEIGFEKITLPQILHRLSEDALIGNLYYLKAFNDGSEYIDFNHRWCENIKSFPYYKNYEKDKLIQLGNFLGTTDADSQINTIKIYLSFFENYRKNAMNEFDRFGKTSPLFGLFAGAAAFILLV